MRKLLLLTAALFTTTSAFAAGLSTEMYLGTTIPEVQAHLSAMGYQVRKSETENGKIEIYFVKDNQMGEVYVSTKTGKITKLEMR